MNDDFVQALRDGDPQAIRAADRLLRRMANTTLPEEMALTAREKEVLYRLSVGDTIQQAAHTIGIPKETVRGHVKHARAKLRARNKTHAVALALRRRLIT